jgi:serine/threonine protein phosphatase PrpC
VTVFEVEIVQEPKRVLELGGVSYRGKAHFSTGLARQDSYCLMRLGNQVVLCIADGVSNSRLSHIGSGFVTLNIEKALSEIFPSGITEDPESWMKVNHWLSNGLVKVHESNLQRKGTPIGDDAVTRRLSAANDLATTFELIICDLQIDGNGFLPGIHVRLAGDGLIFGSAEARTMIGLARGDGFLKNHEVTALPVTDEEAKIQKFRLAPGDYLALVTDGIGDRLTTDVRFANEFHADLGKRSLTRLELSKAIVRYSTGISDDLTVVVARLK